MQLTSGTRKQCNNLRVSIDRIDNLRGYTKGNIHLVVWQFNNAKGAGTVSGLINSATAPSNSDLTAAVSAVVAQINVQLIAQSQPPLDPNTDRLGKADYVAATTASPGIGDAVDKALDFLVTCTTLPPTLVTAINQSTDTVVDPTPTGGTGGF